MRCLSAFSAPKNPVRDDGGSWFESLHQQIIRGCLTSVILGAAAFPAHGLEAVFNTATDIPVTASSYTATGEATFSLNFAPTPGTNLTVVKNTGLPFISGQFSNLANGATVNLTYNGTTYPFVAWYYGGDRNNDLALLWPHTGLATWGNNDFGQLGDNSISSRLGPVDVEQGGVLLGKTIVQVAHGGSHNLALCSDGTIAAWGANNNGQLGDNSKTDRVVPVVVNAVSGTSALSGKMVVAIAAGRGHSLALCSDGTVAAWGWNGYGQLGDNSNTYRQVPVAVNVASGSSALSGKTVVAVAAGGFHSLALCSDSSLVAWGNNEVGQLGDNSTTQRSVPATVNTASGTSALFGKTVVSMAAGHEHSLALCNDGTVVAWGWNGYGQLGDNSTTNHQVPVAVNAASGTSALSGKTTVAVAAGGYHSLALCNDGTLSAWGSNNYGQLGDNSKIGRLIPVAVNVESGMSALFNKTVVAITTGIEHSLALCSDGTLVAWGANVYGKLGNEGWASRQAPEAVNVGAGTSALEGRRVSQLSHSSQATHILVNYGTTKPEVKMEVLEPTTTTLTHQVSTVDFSSAFAVKRTFRLSNIGGLKLIGVSARLSGSDAASFVLVSQPSSAIAGGNATTFHVVSTNRSLDRKNVTLEITSNDSDENPFRIALVGSKTAIFEAHFTANDDIPLSDPSVNASGIKVNMSLNFTPTPGTNLTVIKNTGPAFISGQFSNLANGTTVRLTHNNKIYRFIAWYYGGQGNNDLVLLWPQTGLAAWGYNYNGQLGDNSTISRSAPVRVEQEGVLLGKTIVQVAHGGMHSLALCSDGTVAAWGNNQYGQLGDRTETQRMIPVAVNRDAGTSALSGKIVVAISAGGSHSLALCSDGTVAAWGNNFDSQLGTPDIFPSSSDVPLRVENRATLRWGPSALAGKTVTAIAAGEDHSLALCSDGTVASWGENSSGQLGNSHWNVEAALPVVVDRTTSSSALYGKSVVAIACGSLHSLALCSDGTIATWGDNYYGQLGNVSSGLRSYNPVLVDSDSPYGSALLNKTPVALAAGSSHSLALCSDGTIAAWGDNYYGQLGNNTTTPNARPIKVEAATSALAGKTVTDISVGYDHSLALCSDGKAVAWGGNFYGQLGDNTSTSRLLPVEVNNEAETSVLSGKKVSGFSVGSAGAHHLAIYGLPKPALSITANGLDLDNGDISPSSADSTDFGNSALINTQVSHSFTITNEEDTPLHLTGSPLVTLSGPGSDAFEVTRLPADTLLPGASSRFIITFAPTFPKLYTADVKILSDAENTPVFTFRIQGLGALNKARSQTITFNAPDTVYWGQRAVNLNAYASSGLPVTLNVLHAGTTVFRYRIVGNTLSFIGTGTIKVQATQAGGDNYAAAPTVVKTIKVKYTPTTLTLLYLAQTYTGTPREISTLGGTGSVAVEYKIGTTFGTTAPTNVGSYPVRATDSKGTKTGTLVIAKAPLYVMPSNQRKFVGQDNQALSLSYEGWVNGETDSLITTAPILKTTATKTSLGGVYPITASGGVAPTNYKFFYLQGSLVVETLAGSYEALLRDGGDVLLGKLAITTSATNTSFSGKLFCKDEKAALSFTGSLLSSAETESATGSASVSSGGIPYVISVIIKNDGSLSASVTRDGSLYASSSDGRYLLHLAKTKTVLYRGAHTAVLEPAVPTADAVPVGAGWATASISSKGVMTLAGRLGDGTSFTSALMPDEEADPTYRLFVQPYKTGKSTRTQSHLSGAITLQPHPSAAVTLAGRRYAESAALTWAKAGLITDTAYRTDFGPVNTVLMLDPWLAPKAAKGSIPAITLAHRLGLTNNSFEVQHSDTGSILNGNLPSRVGFSSKYLVSVITPAPTVNSTKWKVKLNVTKGTFSGSFELADIPLKPRVVTFSGVLRQPASEPDTLIGDGHYILPPLSGTEKTTGEIMFLRP